MPDLPLPAPTPPSQPAGAKPPASAVKPVAAAPTPQDQAPIQPPPSTLQTAKAAFTANPGPVRGPASGVPATPQVGVPPAPGRPPVTPPSNAPAGVIRPGVAGQARPGGVAGQAAPSAPAAAAPPGGVPPAGARPPAGSTPPAGTKIATVRQSPLKFLPFIIGGLVVIGLLIFAVSTLFRAFSPQPSVSDPGSQTTNGGGRATVPTNQTKITYWGLWEPTAVMETIIRDFEAANPQIDVEYVSQSHRDYRERLQTAVASGQGPDVFRFHASWVPMIRNELAAMPNTVMSPTEFTQTFYPVAAQQLMSGGQILGVPSYYDGLGLYYNREILRNAGAEPPTTWAQLRTLATQLTIRDQSGRIQRSGLAIGNSVNVEHFADIIGLLMLQNGADPSDPTSREASDAMLFYTNFAKEDRVWDETLPSSTIAFARGDAAMMLAPSWRAHEVKNTNPNLDFAIAPVPKLGQNTIAWASYWAEGVSAQSREKEAAWAFVEYLTSEAVARQLYSAQSQVRSFGTPYARVSLASELAGDPYVGAYLVDAPVAQDWYLNSFTHDNGLNDQIIKYYQDAVTAILSGRDVTDTMRTVDLGTRQVLRQYNVPASGGSNEIMSTFQR